MITGSRQLGHITANCSSLRLGMATNSLTTSMLERIEISRLCNLLLEKALGFGSHDSKFEHFNEVKTQENATLKLRTVGFNKRPWACAGWGVHATRRLRSIQRQSVTSIKGSIFQVRSLNFTGNHLHFPVLLIPTPVTASISCQNIHFSCNYYRFFCKI